MKPTMTPDARVYPIRCGHEPQWRAVKWQPDPRYRAGGFWTEKCYECIHQRYAKIAHVRRSKRAELLRSNRRKRWAALLDREWPKYFARHPDMREAAA